MVLEYQQQEVQEKEFALCLNMIVKNESHIIKDKLTKLLQKIKFDYWVISDTGSTDKTKEIITDFFKEVGIPGEIYEDDWVDFSHNRNRALEYAFGKSKYLLVFDADDEICGDFVLPELTRDSYSLQFGSYTRPQIVNNRKRWKYVGVLHEYICSADSRIDDANTEIIKGPYHVISGRSGNRNLDSNKYLKDAIILEKAYNDAVNAKDNMHIRYGFYCANSYYDCGKYESAISWYKKTLENGGWAQEKYVSCLKLYNCYNNLDNKEAGFFYLIKSAEYDRERAECYYELIKYYSGSGLYNVAYGYYGVLRDFYRDTYLNDDLNNKLFVDMSISEFHLPYYVVIVCEKMRDYETGIHMYKILFTKKCKIFDTWLVSNMLYNLQFFTEHVKEEDKSAFYSLFQEYVDFLIANNYPLSDDKHEFMKTYEKYGIVVVPSRFESVFSKDKEECSRSKKILFYSGFAPFAWNYTYSTQHALGGSETALANLSKLFPSDFEIYVAGNVLEEKIANNDNSHRNVTYVNIQNLSNLIKTNAFHTVIVSRYVGFYDMFPETAYYQSFIWGHDVVLLSSGSNMDVESILRKWSDKITGCVCQTEWHKKLFVTNYPMLKDKMFVINNGIIVDKFINKPVKIPNRFIYTSCSERGLERLLQLWPKIIEKMPDAELYISSYNQFPSNEFEFRLRDVIEKLEGVKHLGSLNKTQLYEMMASAEYWLYPTSFSETSCITAMEMLMSEVICIYYPLAGLNNTLGKYGIQVIPGTEIQSIMNLSEKRKTEMKINGKEYAMSCSWENRAKEWAGVLGLGLNNQHKDKQENNVTNMIKNMSNDKNTDTDVCIKYGKQYNNIDVTEYVLKNLTTDGKIHIPKDDNYRASIFGDPLFRVKKCIFITDKLGKILKEFDYNIEVNYSLKREFNTSCIKVINLERRPDRKADITNQLQKHGINDYTLVEAVDGSQLEETQDLANLFQGNNFNNNKGVIGCALSHLKLWYELINDTNNDYYVILEDDIELYDDFKNKLKEYCTLFQQYGAEHLSLGVYDCNNEEQRKISTENVTIFRKNVYKFWNITFAYIISKQAAQKIIDFVNICSIKCAIDNPRAYGDILVHHHTTQCIAKQKNVNVFGSDIISSNCFSFSNNSNYNNKEIKIAFCDFWVEGYHGDCFDKKSNFITNIFDKANKKYTVVEPSQNPDTIIFSAMGNENEHTRHQNIRRVYYCGEPFVPREDVDYNITFDHTRPKNFRFPLWAAFMNSYLFEECERRKNGITTVPKRNKFCSFICNGECKTTWRKEIVEKLSQYKRIDCGGRFLNNIGYTVPRGTSCSGKIEHNLNYKFAIAFENEDHPGYVTEKICDVYKSNCIPIYSGNREVVEDFNPNTFINSNDFKNLDELVEYVIKVDNDDELYASYFKEPMFSNKWLDIFNDPHNTFYKNITDCILGTKINLYSNDIITYSQASQDVFVINLLQHKKNGYFVEIGTNDPIEGNNTYLLEKNYEFKGLLVEYESYYENRYKQHRPNSIYIIDDARNINYKKVLDDNKFPKNIDYLQIDLDVDNKSTLDTLILIDNTVFDTYKFATITFEHDYYRGDFFNTREISREIFKKRGYLLVFPDVCTDQGCVGTGWQPFEDWYVHPDLIDMNLVNMFKTDKSLRHDYIRGIITRDSRNKQNILKSQEKMKIIFSNNCSVGDVYFSQPFIKNIVENNPDNDYYIYHQTCSYYFTDILKIKDVNKIPELKELLYQVFNFKINLYDLVNIQNMSSYVYRYDKTNNILLICTWLGCIRNKYPMLECNMISYNNAYKLFINDINKDLNFDLKYNDKLSLDVYPSVPILDIKKYREFKDKNFNKNIIFYYNFLPFSGQSYPVKNYDEHNEIIKNLSENNIVVIPHKQSYKGNTENVYFADDFLENVEYYDAKNFYYHAQMAYESDYSIYFDLGRSFMSMNKTFIEDNNNNNNIRIHITNNEYYYNSLNNNLLVSKNYMNLIKVNNYIDIIDKLNNEIYIYKTKTV